MSDYGVYFDLEKLRITNFYRKADKDKDTNKEICSKNINYNLLLNKYLDYDYEWEEEYDKNKKCMDYKKDANGNKIPKRDGEGNICKKKKYIKAYNFGVIKELLDYIGKKEKYIKNYYDMHGYEKFSIKYKNSSKLLVGHGEVSVREVSIKLDHIYGIPFIPASSIKGAFRNYLNEKYNPSDENEIKQEFEAIKDIFGSKDRRGEVIFLDTYPGKFIIGTDIMTPHYNNYYNAKDKPEEPSDKTGPVPIEFPVINEGAEFNFTIFLKKQFYKIGSETINLKELFEEFLSEKPLGAKSSVGYGLFEKC